MIYSINHLFSRPGISDKDTRNATLLPPIAIITHDYSHALSTKNACRVYHVESVSKMGLVLSISFLHI